MKTDQATLARSAEHLAFVTVHEPDYMAYATFSPKGFRARTGRRFAEARRVRTGFNPKWTDASKAKWTDVSAGIAAENEKVIERAFARGAARAQALAYPPEKPDGGIPVVGQRRRPVRSGP